MRYGLGIDIGTSTTGAAAGTAGGTADGVTMVTLAGETRIPTAVSVGDSGLLTGELAVARDPFHAVRGFKRELGDPTPIVLGGSPYPPSALLAAVARDVVSVATARLGQPPEATVLMRPAIWGPYRRQMFDDAVDLAGVTDARVTTEAQAVATWFGGTRPDPGRLVLVYDLGGGTCDTAVMHATAEGWEIVGSADGADRVGGLEFDRIILETVDDASGGAVSRLDQSDPAQALLLARIRASCVTAKEALSRTHQVTVPLPLPDGSRTVELSREEFERRIDPLLDATVEAVYRTLESAAVEPAAIVQVLMAGGASRTPAVIRRIEEEFKRPLSVNPHPENAAALGAAMLAAAQLDDEADDDSLGVAAVDARPETTPGDHPDPADDELPDAVLGQTSGTAGHRGRRIGGAVAALLGLLAAVVLITSDRFPPADHGSPQAAQQPAPSPSAGASSASASHPASASPSATAAPPTASRTPNRATTSPASTKRPTTPPSSTRRPSARTPSTRPAAPAAPAPAGPAAVLTSPANGTQVSRSGGFIASGTVSNLGSHTVWILDRVEGGYVVDTIAEINGTRWSAEDRPLGDSSDRLPFSITVVAVLADPGCRSRLAAANDAEISAIPTGCRTFGQVTVNVVSS